MSFIIGRRALAAAGLAAGVALAAGTTHAQEARTPSALRQAFDAAWARQPEALAFADRREAAQAAERVAGSWTAQPPSIEVSARTGRFTRDQGQRELEAGVALPLWLPGEQRLAKSVAEAELAAVSSRMVGAQLRIAATVRDAYWLWQRALIDREIAASRLENARRLAADVAKRVAAGELSRADSHQAEGAVATAEAGSAEAGAALAVAAQQLTALSGAQPSSSANPAAEPAPTAALEASRHPAIGELADKVEAARRSAELAGVQRGANPELLVGAVRERAGFGDSTDTALILGMRIPFATQDRRDARRALARAELREAEAALANARLRAQADLDIARARIDAAGLQLTASERRARLAAETRRFFERAFRLGEADLPTRLRIELEAYEAERQAARARIELGAATSQLRQALGLIPE